MFMGLSAYTYDDKTDIIGILWRIYLAVHTLKLINFYMLYSRMFSFFYVFFLLRTYRQEGKHRNLLHIVHSDQWT